MPFWDFLKRGQPIEVFTPNVTYVADVEGLTEALNIGGMSPAKLWATQPHLRTVVSFVARNIAQLGLHVFERVGETDRRRDRASIAARALDDVDGTMTTYDLVFALVGDLLLYDRAYWWVAPSSDLPSGVMIRRLPPSWVSENRADPWTVKSYRVALAGRVVTVPAANVLAFTGYAPGKPGWGSSTVESLKQTLQEQIEAAAYRADVWKRGGRVSAVLERPANAPDWSETDIERFREDWYAKYTGRGPGAGGTPILQDGMTLKRIDFNAHEQQFVEASKLSMATVAAAFHVNPTMVGQLDNANFSNVREFRKMLYGDSLGPLLAQIEQRINRFLLPALGMDRSVFYVEFNIAEKLQGNFEEQTQALQSAVGRPWMTADEARARLNMRSLGGDADSLVTPLNVLVGGQASPNDSGSQNRSPKSIEPLFKAAITDTQRDKIAEVLTGFFKRQGSAVLSRIGGGGDWWDSERWDSELADSLAAVTHTVASILGPVEAKRLGYDDGYDPAATVNFLKAVAQRYAGNINATTKGQLDEQLAADDPDPAHTFAVAQDSRAKGAAVGIGTFIAAFATVEAARQIGRREGFTPTKTWVTGTNPRPAHAAMNGETVPIDEPFSNGAHYPCDTGNPDDSGCNCSVVVALQSGS